MFDQVGGDALGNIAKFASASREARLVRRFVLQAAARVLLPEERVAVCLCRPVPGCASVEVWYSEKHQRAHYKRLQVCGGVWSCPVCASRITEVRRLELQAAIDNGVYRPVLVTLTVRHHKGDALALVLGGLLDAYRKFTAGRAYQGFKRDFGVVGTVKALEATHGENGWHPHLHLLVFMRAGVDSAALSAWVKGRWMECVARAGLDASWERGADVKDAWMWIVEYVAKWGHEPEFGVDFEVAKGAAKLGRRGGRTPNQLLADFVDGDIPAGMLWREFARTFKGRSQLRWSKGLRDILGLGAPKTDLEIVQETEDNASRLLASLTLEQWRAVVRAGLQGDLLALAQAGDAVALWRWLGNVPGMPEGDLAVFMPKHRLVGAVREGDVVRWMEGETFVTGYVREVGLSRVKVDVWGGSKLRQVWVNSCDVRVVGNDEMGK